MPDLALSDVKVVDFTQYIAGPYGTKMLADYGAEVLKVERPNGGDPGRRLGPFAGDDPHPEKSLQFYHLNTNKRSLTLNLKTETGVQIAKELIKDADIVVESFRPGVMERLGLGYPVLKELNPNLVMTSVSNFGQTGPYRDYQAADITIFAIGGPLSTGGVREREPIKLAAEIVQCQAGNVALVATLAGFYTARYQGIGQHIDISIYETQAGTVNTRLANLIAYQYTGAIFLRRPLAGAASQYPSGVYQCADGYINISGGLADFPRTCQVIDRPDLAQSKYATPDGQTNPELREEFLTTIWNPWLMQHTKREVVESAQSIPMRCTALNTMDDIVTSPHYEVREFFIPGEHPILGKVKQVGPPFKMGQTPAQLRRTAPLLGEANEEVYCGRLGYSKEDLVKLRERGVI